MAIFKKTSIILLIIISNSFVAQTNKKLGIIYGIGYNTQVKENNKIAPVSFWYYNTFSPILGLVYRDSIYKFLSIKTSVYYVQRGVKFDYIFDTPSYYLRSKQSFTAHYISCPIKLYANFKNFFIGGGVEASFLIKAHNISQVDQKIPSANFQQTNKIDRWFSEPLYNAIDAGFNISGGYRFKHFEIEGSMFHGLIPPRKFDYFSIQHFEFTYLFQETFSICINYFPYKKYWKKKAKAITQ